MSTFKGTPGPWAVQGSQSKPAFNVIGTVLGGKYKIARCPYETDYPKIAQQEFDEARANAQLIACAPEMLEMLEYLLEKLEANATITNGWNTQISAIKALIQKATTL